MKDKHVILGVHIQNRARDVMKVQQALTQYGCNIKTRLGLHEVDENFCAAGGVVLLELFGDEGECAALEIALSGLDGVEVQKMIFTHP
jgi:hypothetical protein